MIFQLVSRFSNAEFVYFVILFTLSVGLIISSIEDIVNWPMFEKKGLLSWKISKHRSPIFIKGYLAKAVDCILNDRSFRCILYLKLALTIALLILSAFGIISSFVVLSIIITLLLVSLRSQYGLDGSYQMSLIVLFGILIASFFDMHSKVSTLCLWFIGGQVVLAYFIAGLTKIISPIWRKTHALNAILSTKTYGHEKLFKLVTKNKYIGFILCWPMIIFELSFASCFGSVNLCLTFFLIGFLFHLFNAVIMGLNTFMFAFLSTYPAVLYCFTRLH
jgi:hypothetical protein